MAFTLVAMAYDITITLPFFRPRICNALKKFTSEPRPSADCKFVDGRSVEATTSRNIFQMSSLKDSRDLFGPCLTGQVRHNIKSYCCCRHNEHPEHPLVGPSPHVGQIHWGEHPQTASSSKNPSPGTVWGCCLLFQVLSLCLGAFRELSCEPPTTCRDRRARISVLQRLRADRRDKRLPSA